MNLAIVLKSRLLLGFLLSIVKLIDLEIIGALEVIRTPDIRLRRPTLYPAELRAQCLVNSPQFINIIGFKLFAHINLILSANVIICNV